jgi:hypothetical protein
VKGVVFNVVEEVVTELYDAATWDDLLAAAEVDGAYTALGNYGDDELLGIVDAAAAATGMALDDLWRTVGRLALPRLAARLPDLAAQAGDARSFLMAVNDIIHPEVRALYPESVPPVFEFEMSAAHLLVRYRSARRLDALAQGLMIGCGDLFDEVVHVEPIGGATAPDEALFSVRFEGSPP